MNPFTSPNPSAPLRPWEYPEHERYYVDVDSSGESFAALCEALRDQEPSRAGVRALVHGPAGCGKSALINRTVDWLKARLAGQGQQVRIVDLSDEVLPGTASEQKLRAQCALLAEALYSDGDLEGPEHDVLVSRADDPLLFTSALEALLRRKSLVLMLILPRLEISKDLDLFASAWRRRRVVAFVESDDVDVHARCRQLYGSVSANPVIACSVGTLRAGDGWAYVEARIALAHQAAGVSPLRMDREVLDAFMTERLSGGLAPSIRELQVTCQAVYERALQGSQEVVSITDFGLHYMRLGRL